MGGTKGDQSDHMPKYKRDLPGALTGKASGQSSATEDEVMMTGHKTVQENASLTLTSTAPPNGTIWEAEAACIGVSIYFDLC